MQTVSLGHRWSYLFWILLGTMTLPELAAAQTPPRAVPDPEEVSLETRDGVRLGATYYPSLLGREAVPVVMLHDFKEVRTVFNSLARSLQAPDDERFDSHAVLAVDLRGHGSSTTGINRLGETYDLIASRLRPEDFADMVRFDMEAVRKFLVERNDEQELNLNKLCLLGSGMGANVAIVWAGVDWDAPQLARLKQGQDVKALVLASPDWQKRGLPLVDSLRHPAVREELSVMLVYGEEDRDAASDAENVYEILERFREDPPLDQVREHKSLFRYTLPTKLQGTKLLVEREFEMLPKLDGFLKTRLSNQDFPWIPRLKE